MGGVRDLAGPLECTEGVLAPGSYAVLSVVDTGVGISEDKLHSIFEPFATSKGHRGTGFGDGMSVEVRFLTEILEDFRRFIDEIWRF